MEQAIRQAEEIQGPVYMLVNSAGVSVSERFEQTNIEDFRRLMEVNYLSAVYTTRATIPLMRERKEGRILLLSSQAGQLGVFGYSAYSASKFALRGLAEAVQMEVTPYNIHFTLGFPPDTNTPGFQKEVEMGKPKENVMISETSGIFQADYVAKVLLQDAVNGKFLSYIGLDGFMLSNLTCGMSPASSVLEVASQVLTMGIFRLISLFYLNSFQQIVLKCKNERVLENKEK